MTVMKCAARFSNKDTKKTNFDKKRREMIITIMLTTITLPHMGEVNKYQQNSVTFLTLDKYVVSQSVSQSVCVYNIAICSSRTLPPSSQRLTWPRSRCTLGQSGSLAVPVGLT